MHGLLTRSKDRQCLQEVLKRVASEIVEQRKNAIEVISEIIRISSDSTTVFSQSSWYNSGLIASFTYNILMLSGVHIDFFSHMTLAGKI